MKALRECPVCGQSDLTRVFTCQDYTVSHETFQLVRCTHCGFVFTNPRPEDDALPKYYQSDAYISHTDKLQSPVELVYKIARTFTLKWKYNLIRSQTLQNPSSVLDFGCGTGAFLQECQSHGMKVSGVEPSARARDQAKKNTDAAIESDLKNIRDRYQVITLWHVLEHVTDFHTTLQSLQDHLHESGTIFIAVPNLKSQDALRYGEHWAAYDVPRHLWHFSRSTMERVLNGNNLKLIKIVPMKLDAYYVSLLSEKYKNPAGGLSNMTKAIIQGWKSNRAAKVTGEYSSLIYIARK